MAVDSGGKSVAERIAADRKLAEREKFIMRAFEEPDNSADFLDIAEFLNKVYGEGRVTVEIEDTYRNIGEAIKPCFEIVEAIDAAMKAEGVAPFYTPMRGGTDGTILSFEGIPCPNICTGGHNFHGRYEYVPVQSMEKIANILIGIVKSFAK